MAFSWTRPAGLVWCSLLLISLFDHCNASTPDNNLEDNMHLFAGDIVLSPEQRSLLQHSKSLRTSRAVVKVTTEKWEDGVVPYTISTSFNDSARRTIEAAMEQIMSDSEDCVHFRPKRTLDLDYVHFFPGEGCYSSVGHQGGRQVISIGSLCESKGVMMHEIVHALGRWHEQSRPDRDEHVNINSANIRTEYLDNFDIIDDETTDQDMSYDFDSIMHYDAYAFTSNGRPTIEPTDSSISLDRLGQREALSETDKAHIKALYCGDEVSLWSRWSSWSECSTSCGSGTQERTRECLGTSPCVGNHSEKRTCHESDCPTEEAVYWGPWSAWSGCSQPCKGQRSRVRDCAQGKTCIGNDIEVEDCSTHKCDGNDVTITTAEWSSWSSWTHCSQRCEGGVKYRSRRCIIKDETAAESSSSSSSSSSCPGASVEEQNCFVNISCDVSSSSESEAHITDVGEICSQNQCFNETCLAGLIHLGCYQFPQDSLRVIEVNNDDNDGDLSVLVSSCGREAHLRNLPGFGLARNNCYIGLEGGNMTSLIQAGPLSTDDCQNSRDHIQVYQIIDEEMFGLSLRVSESCGADYCRQVVSGGVDHGAELYCSGAVKTAVMHKLAMCLNFLLLIWLTA